MNGRLDEVAIWNRALLDSEIAHLYNGGLGNPVFPVPEPATLVLLIYVAAGCCSGRAAPHRKFQQLIAA